MLNTMANVRWEHYPHVVGNELARAWLVLESNLGLAANTLDAYGRALQDYLAFSADQNTPVITATKDHIAEYVRHLTSRPGQRGPNVVVLDSDAGLANATLRQRISSRIPEWGVAANKYPNKQGQTRGQAFKDFYATLDKLHVPFGPAFYYAHSPGGSSRIDANGALLPEAKTLALDGGEHSIAPLPEQTGGTDAKARTVIVGVNIWNEQFLSKADQDNELEQMAASGVKVIRTGLVDYNMEFIIKPYQHGISTVAIVFPFPGSKTWSDVILSKITPEEFTAKFKPLLEKLEIAGVRLDAFELGNEINTSRFNGDLPNPGSGRELRLADLNSPKDPEASAVARSYRAYVQVMAALKDLRDHSKLNQHTPILSAGLAQKLGTKQVEVILRDSIEFFRQKGIDKLVDGYGIHVYPSADLKRPVSARITSLDEDMFSACRQGGKPCWVTKWGFGNSDESCPAVEGTRVK